jgi:Uma2 family endonuclease
MLAAAPDCITPKVEIIPEPARDAEGRIICPSSDGLPITWISTHWKSMIYLKEGIQSYFEDRDDAFVAGDLSWYPVEGKPTVVVAPDVFVAMGRPRGDRSSYTQWEEDNVAPQVVFEVLSEGSAVLEMQRKMRSYSTHGVLEYVIYDPNAGVLDVRLRDGAGGLIPLEDSQGWTSGVLGLSFWVSPDGELSITMPSGKRILLPQKMAAARREAEAAKAAAAEKAAALAQRLRELGIYPVELS